MIESKDVLYDAIGAGDTNSVSEFLASNPDFMSDFESMFNCMFGVVHWGSVEMLDVLLAHGADINVMKPKIFHFGPLMSAVDKQNITMAEALIGRGARLRSGIPKQCGEDLVFSAAQTGNAAIVKLLIDAGADVHCAFRTDSGGLINALGIAEREGFEDVAGLLRAAGCHEATEADLVELGLAAESVATMRENGTGTQISDLDFENHELICDHMSQYFGPVVEESIQEILPATGISVNLCRGEDGKPNVLFTTGMSDKPMSVPKGEENFQYAELMFELPSDWPLLDQPSSMTDEIFWPISWIRQLAHYPHANESWLTGEYCVISTDDPPKALGPNTELSCFLLIAQCDPRTMVALKGKSHPCHLYRVVPIYTEERDLFLKSGLDIFWDKLSAVPVGFTLEVDRPNAAK